MPVTQTITFSVTPPTIGETPDTFERKAIGVWNELKNITVPSMNTAFSQMNALEANINSKEATVVAKEALMNQHYTEIDTVAGISVSVITVAGIRASVITVAGISASVITVAGISANVSTVAGMQANIASVVTNITSIQNAEANATIAQNSANAAVLAANAAVLTANVTMWVSGTSYLTGANVWSPIDFQTYRAKVNTSGTTDPSSDTTNWQKLSGASGMILDTTTANTYNILASGIYRNYSAKAVYAMLNSNNNLVYANTQNGFHTVFTDGDYVSATYNSETALSNTTANYSNSVSKRLSTGYLSSSVAASLQYLSSGQDPLLEKIDESHVLAVSVGTSANTQKAHVIAISSSSPMLSSISNATILEAISAGGTSSNSYITKVDNGRFLLVSYYQDTATTTYKVRAQLIMVDGSYNITTSSVYQIGTGNASVGMGLKGVTKLDATRYAIKYYDGATATSKHALCVVNVETNNTLTVGTPWNSATTFAVLQYASNGITQINGTNCYIGSYHVDTTTDYQRRYTFNIVGTTITMLSDFGTVNDYTLTGAAYWNVPNTNVVIEFKSYGASAVYGLPITVDTTTGVMTNGTVSASLTAAQTGVTGISSFVPYIQYQDATYYYVVFDNKTALRVSKTTYACSSPTVTTDLRIGTTSTESVIFKTSATSGVDVQYLLFTGAKSSTPTINTQALYGYATAFTASTEYRHIKSVMNGKFFVLPKLNGASSVISLLALSKDIILTEVNNV